MSQIQPNEICNDHQNENILNFDDDFKFDFVEFETLRNHRD